jgi:hypothetical protein
MITEAFQVILKYVAPGQENIVIQNVCKKLSFASNDSEEKLDPMTEALKELNISFWAILSSSQSEYLGSLGKYLYRL